MKAVLLALALLSSSPALAAEEWIDLADSDTRTWSAKPGTFDITTNKAGDDVVAAVGRVVRKNENRTEVEKWYVRVSDCRAGYGKLVTLSVDGTFKYENDFVTDSGNVASGIAESLCYFYDAVQKRREELSL